MSMNLAARASHSHHVTGHAPARARTASPGRNADLGRGTGAALRFAPFVWFRNKLRARPGTTLAHCVFAIAAVIIIANALALQRQDSPRSFIGEQAAAQAASQSRTTLPVAGVPVPPVRPAEIGTTPPRQQIAAAQPTATSRDPIGDLIRSGQAPAGAEQARAITAARPVTETRPVMAAQRALDRVGFGPVKSDGVFGEETRAALERFERERRIPVTRDLSPRTLRELTAASGIRME